MIILIILIIVLLLSFTYIKNLFKNDVAILDEVKLKESEPSNNGFALMLEQKDGTYKESNESTWPTDMVFNSELSGCIDINGNIIKDSLSFDSTNNIVNVSVSGTTYCYIYFDTKKPAVTLTVSTDGVSNTLPTYNHYRQILTCDDGTSSSFNVKYQRLEISNIGNTNTKCNLNYANDTNTYTLLKDKVESDNPTNNKGYRYSGKQPDNWVWFNNELWRIIGSVPTTLSDGTTVKKRVKIIRAESIGGLVYDSDSNTRWGENTLYDLLNNYYYGKKDATGDSPCLGYSNSYYALCNYTNKGISSSATDYYGRMVIDVYMNVGTVSDTSTAISAAYTEEASTLTSNTEKIGLMSFSDYGYATSGITYSSVKLTNLSSYTKNNWLYGQGSEWTMTPTGTSYVMFVNSYGYLSTSVMSDSAVRPVLYLDPSVYIISGDGTEGNPYTLGM